jgi:hypothetical protein
MDPIVVHVVSLVGAVLVLAGYAGQQYAGLRSDGALYAVLNLAGSAMLAATALRPLNPGVLLLETVWALISLGILLRAGRPRPGAPEPPGA